MKHKFFSFCIIFAIFLSMNLVAVADSTYYDSATDYEYMYGDLNSDRSIDSKDLILLRKILLEIPSKCDMKAADVNKDRTVNIVDLVRLKKILTTI